MSRVSVDDLTDPEGQIDPSRVAAYIEQLCAEAATDRDEFDPDQAMTYLREGAGRAIGLYILLRTGGRQYRFKTEEFEQLEQAMNEWLSLYAASHGIEGEIDASIRVAAELLLETNDIVDVADQLTGVDTTRS